REGRSGGDLPGVSAAVVRGGGQPRGGGGARGGGEAPGGERALPAGGRGDVVPRDGGAAAAAVPRPSHPALGPSGLADAGGSGLRQAGERADDARDARGGLAVRRRAGGAGAGHRVPAAGRERGGGGAVDGGRGLAGPLRGLRRGRGPSPPGARAARERRPGRRGT
ncbi:MAG: hypothetical protein ACK559_08415, partial [bacterium]